MTNKIQQKYGCFLTLLEESIKKYWDYDALTDYEGSTFQYNDVARKIEKLHILFENAGIQPKDKIAICGRNCANWAVAFFATLTYGAVAVPILHEFTPDQVHNIVNHSEAKLLFAGDQIWPTLNSKEMPNIEGVINLSTFFCFESRSAKLTEARERLNEFFGKKYPKNFRAEHINYRKPDTEELAMINYTSGTTSFSKGVMIPYRALWSNVDFGFQVLGEAIRPKSKIISVLPMAHMYGMAFEFLFEFCNGCHIFFLNRMPTPQIIFKAFKEVQPDIVITVPLILEKVVRKAILPRLEQGALKALLKLPLINNKIYAKINEKLKEAFGGKFYEVIIGGAALNQEIEALLLKLGFPFTVGYGATECAPIITYIDYKQFKKGSCGVAAPRMEVKIDSPDPQNIVGEILCKGANVMLGYYKNEEATCEVLTSDGWYRTGDLGVLDQDGFLYIKGRCKNMLLGSSGQNIYPEEIESALNNLPMVNECLVVQHKEKLVALVYPDPETSKGLTQEDLAKIMETNRKDLNETLPNYSQISKIVLRTEEFEKTPKKSIKRFLYLNVLEN